MNDVIICHGSNCVNNRNQLIEHIEMRGIRSKRTKISEAAMYNPSVANSEMTMFRKIEFVNSELAERGPSVFTMFSTPLKARKNAAIYQVISFTNTLTGSTAAPGS